MNPDLPSVSVPEDRRALVAIDLGAESCRISLLRWIEGRAQIGLVHRFPNGPVERNGSMHWDLESIRRGIVEGLRRCADIATEGIRSIGVDGWAVDYVRLDPAGNPIADPFCYRDKRNLCAFEDVHRRIGVERLYALTGIQPLTINTLYQLYADSTAGFAIHTPWLTIPEYILYWLGGKRVAEYTNATHTGLVDLATKNWSREIFESVGLSIEAAPKVVPSGTDVGKLSGPLAKLSALQNTRLIAPACHDTASAIAGIAATEQDWVYISSGTWSLVGALIDTPCNTEEARQKGFTNLGATGDKICFHKNVNGMWLLRQCMEEWTRLGKPWTLPDLIEQAEFIEAPDCVLDLEDRDLLLAGDMPARINTQRRALGFPALEESPSKAPLFASLIFHSLAHKYAQVLQDMKTITGRNFTCIYVVGGGSRNKLLNRLTQRASGIKVSSGEVESSTVGNFSVQLVAPPFNRAS